MFNAHVRFLFLVVLADLTNGGKLPGISTMVSECELEAVNIGTRLVDRFNNFDEETEWDMRIHHDYLTTHLGFAGWIQTGLWKSNGLTAHRKHAPTLHKVYLVADDERIMYANHFYI